MYNSSNGLVPSMASDGDLVNSGFVKKTNRETIYTNARYPGWLFKRVDDLNSALSCGGIMIFGAASAAIAYLGHTAENVMSSGNIGSWVRPSNVDVVSGKRVAWENTQSQRLSRLLTSLYFDGYVRRTHTFGGSPLCVAVVTKATSGFMIDFNGVTPSGGWGDQSDNMTRSGVPQTTTAGNGLVYCDTAADSMRGNVQQSTVSGFIFYGWKQNKRDWLSRAKNGFLSSMDGKIREAYSTAIDEVIAATPTVDSVVDGVNFIFGLVGNEVMLAAGRRNSNSPSEGYSATSPIFCVTNRYGSYAEPYDRYAVPGTPNETDRFSVYYSFLSDSEVFGVFPGAVPAVHRIVGTNSSSGAGINGDKGNQHPWFSALSVPYGTVTLNEGNPIPISSIMAALFPASRPSVVDFTNLPDLSLIARVEDEIRPLHRYVPEFKVTSSSSDTEVSNATGNGVLDVKDSDDRLNRALPNLSPFARFIVETTLDIDRRVMRTT